MILDKDTIMKALWSNGKKTANGWWKDCLFDVYAAVNDHQRTNNITGNLGEIGIFEGRSLVPLVNLKSKTETVVAIDIKNIEKPKKLIESVFGEISNVHIIKGNSKKTKVFEDYGPYRLFYVDGDHSFEAALSDLILAESLVDNGLIFLDDFNNPRYGKNVRKAIDKFIEQNPSWSIVGITGQTLWLSKEEYSIAYRNVFESLGWDIKEDNFYPDVMSFQDPKGLYHYKK